jgi:hypothetical protein
MRVLSANAGLTAGVLLFLGLGACGAPHNADLFRSRSSLGESGAANTGGSAASSNAGGAGASARPPEGSAGDADDSGDESSAPPNGGATSGGGGSASGAGGLASGGAAHAGSSGGPFRDCSQFGTDASYFSDTQHCYLVVHELATFANAQAHCETLGAHLVTLANTAEDEFAWGLLGEAHWIGATDGNGPNDPKQGAFSWVTGEPFTYANWSSGQPNTADSDCGESGLAGHCYEHCAFQWTGGEHVGQWNDRFCLHTIAAICEWDSAK